MKAWRKDSALSNCILTYFLLGKLLCRSEAQVTITTPPENTTVCRGSDVNISCGYQWVTALPVTWIINGTSFDQQEIVNSPLYRLNNPLSPVITSLTVFSISGTTTFQCVVPSIPVITTSTRGTVIVINELTPVMITANVSFKTNAVVITVSWQIITSRTANITMYSIIVMDQYSPAIVTVPANMSSVEISQFPYNGTSIVANREYTITVSAISDQGISCTSDPVVVDTFILQNCEVTSPSVGTIRVSCDSSHQIQINAICRDNNCNNRAVTSNGYSPFTITGFDPGKEYAVSIHVFDGNQVVLNIGITKIIRVIYTITTTSSTSTATTATIYATTTTTMTKIYTSTTVTTTTAADTTAVTNDLCNACTSAIACMSDNENSDESGLSTGAAVAIALVVTFILTLTVTAIITFIVTYVCVKRTLDKASTHNLKHHSPSLQEKVLYEQVRLPSHTVTKNDLELQPNPAYGTSHKVTMDTNPAYESCK